MFTEKHHELLSACEDLKENVGLFCYTKLHIYYYIIMLSAVFTYKHTCIYTKVDTCEYILFCIFDALT